MFKSTSKWLFLGIVIAVIVLFLVQYLSVRKTAIFAYIHHHVGYGTYRYNNSTISAETRLTNISRIPASTTLQPTERLFQHINSITTSLETPMAAISRNILDRYSEYRQIERVGDFKELYDPRFCLVELHNDLTNNTNRTTAGTELIVRIDLYNGYNQSLTQGGDLLNIWLRSTNGTSSVAGYVVDHMNGSYTGHVKAFWAGNVVLKVSVTNTKEGIGLYTNYVNAHGSYKFIKVTFAERNRREVTQCAPKMSDWLNKTYGGFCNLTSDNYNISLFCGKPKSVSCRNWVAYGWDDSLYYDTKTRNVLRYKDVILKEIELTVSPSSKGDLDYPVPDTPCNVLPRALTWNSTVPSGFLYRGVYYNLICLPTINQSMDNYRACLKDRPVISVGDSTTRQWFFRLAKFLKMHYTEGFTNTNAWQKLAHAYDLEWNLDMEWQPHELPFHGSPGSDKKNIKSVAYRLNRIPANSTAIVIIHWYGHIARCCDHVAFREHVRHAKDAIVRLLTRSPDVQIFIKGPHLITFFNALKPYAYIGMFVEQVLLEELSDLLDRVIYLDQWDMSVANENVNIHPIVLLDDISLNNLINFACK